MLMNYVFSWKFAFLQVSCQLFYGPEWLTLCQCYLKMHVVGEGPGATLSVLRHFLSLTSSLLKCSSILGILQARVMEWVAIAFSKKVYNSLLKTSKGALFLFPSYVYVRSFLCIFYTLIKLYYTETLSDQALSLAPD